MNVMGVIVYGERGGLQDQLEAKFVTEEIPFLSLSIPKFSWKRRIVASMDIALAYKDTFLIFLDAWDTIFQGSRKDIEALDIEGSVTFAAQKFCWPDKSREDEYKEIQPEDVGPWRYINSNPMAGYGRDIYEALSWGWARFPIKTNTNSVHLYDVDERFLTNLYLSDARTLFDIRLDTRCDLNQTYLASVPGDLWIENNIIHNKVHDTKPVFVHFNGRTNPPEGMICKPV